MYLENKNIGGILNNKYKKIYLGDKLIQGKETVLTQNQITNNLNNLDKVVTNIEDSRDSYFGVNHIDLKDRLDSEYEKFFLNNTKALFMNKTLNENTFINFTIDGACRDTILKGETLKNYIDSEKVRNFNQTIKGITFTQDYILWDFDTPISYNQWLMIDGVLNDCEPSKTYTAIIEVLEDTLTDMNNTKEKMNIFHWSSINGSNTAPVPNYLSGVGVHKIKVTFLTGNSTNSHLRFHINGSSPGGVQLLKGKMKISKKIMFLEGDWTNRDIPKYFEGIKSLGEDENKISIKTTGKNIFDSNFSKGGIHIDGTEGNIPYWNIKCDNYIKIKPNTSYILSKDIFSDSCIVSYDKNKKLSRYLNSQYKITTLSNEKYVRFTFCSSNSEIPNNPKIQFEKNTTITDYKPYIDNKIETLLPITNGLKSIGYIKDYIDFEKKELHENIGIITFNGLENIMIYTHGSITEEYFGFYFTFKNLSKAFKTSCLWRSLKNNKDFEFLGWNTENTAYCKILKSKLKTPSIEGVKEWLNLNPVKVYYEIDNPIIHKISIENLKTYDGGTNIFLENDIKPTLEFKIPIEQMSYIKNIEDSNKELLEKSRKLKDKLNNSLNSLNSTDQNLISNDLDLDFRIFEIEFASFNIENKH